MSHHPETPASAQHGDYHGHPNYVMTWAVLLVLLFVSLAVGHLDKKLAIFLIFSIAIVKALMVVGSFMHMRWEPKVMWGMVAFGVMCAFFFFFGVYPDVVQVPLQLAK